MKRYNLYRTLILAVMVCSVVFAVGVGCWIKFSGLDYAPSTADVADAKARRQAEKEHAMAAMKEERAEQRADDKQKLERNRKARQEAQAARGATHTAD